MPGSKRTGKSLIAHWVSQHSDIKRVLDVGCGEGTYPKLLKQEYPLLTQADWWGVEIWTPYIERWNLHSMYNHIVNEDARTLDWDKLGHFDLVIFGDVLEHMTKEESQELVKKALAHSRFVVISIPVVHAPSGAWEGNPYEAHVKDDWNHQEVMESFPNIKDWLKKTKTICAYWLEA